MTLADPTIAIADVSLPNLTAQALLRALLKPIPLEGVPLGLKLSSVTAEQDGVHLAVNGDNVPLLPESELRSGRCAAAPA